MRAVMLLSLLLGATFAGCLGAEDAPEPRHTCRSCPEDVDPDQDGKVPLGTFTWGEPPRAGAGNRVSERVASFTVPMDVEQIEVKAVRQHEGIEQERARLALRDSSNHQRGAATFDTVSWGAGDDREELVLKGAPRYGRALDLRYGYQTQPNQVTHELHLEVIGHL